MTRTYKSSEKSEVVSIRIPQTLLNKLDKLKEKEHSDRTSVILRCIDYWVSTDGNVTGDGEYLKRLETIDSNIKEISKLLEESNDKIKSLEKTGAEQQTVIITLLKMLSKENI